MVISLKLDAKKKESGEVKHENLVSNVLIRVKYYIY